MSWKKNGEQIIENRKARFEYHIEDTLEAGIVLSGSEVKSLRYGRASLVDAHASDKEGCLTLFNMNIAEYGGANRFNHRPKRPRKLLLHRREYRRLQGSMARKGVTVVPLKVYFSDRGYVKLLLGLAMGKKKADKRESIKERDRQRDQKRALKDLTRG